MSSKRTARITLPRVSILEYYTTRTSARSLFFFVRSLWLKSVLCFIFSSLGYSSQPEVFRPNQYTMKNKQQLYSATVAAIRRQLVKRKILKRD